MHCQAAADPSSHFIADVLTAYLLQKKKRLQ